MVPWYGIETTLAHTSWLTEDINVDDVVLDYSARIRCASKDEDFEDAATVGNVQFFVVRLGLAVNEGINAMAACDALSQDVYEYGRAVLDDRGQVKRQIADDFEFIAGDLLILHTVTVVPAHRGHDLGLLAASRIIELFGEGFVVCKPQPLQHVRETAAHRATLDPSLKYDLFTKPKAAAKIALQRHWSKLGFKRIGRTDFYGLSTADARPKLRLRSRRAAGGGSGRRRSPNVRCS